jgi:hypothetical protein
MRVTLRVASVVALVISATLAVIFGVDAFGDATQEARLIESAAQSTSLSNIAETTLARTETPAAIALRAKYGAEAARTDGELIATRTEKVEDRRSACEFLIAALLAGILFMLTCAPASDRPPRSASGSH